MSAGVERDLAPGGEGHGPRLGRRLVVSKDGMRLAAEAGCPRAFQAVVGALSEEDEHAQKVYPLGDKEEYEYEDDKYENKHEHEDDQDMVQDVEEDTDDEEYDYANEDNEDDEDANADLYNDDYSEEDYYDNKDEDESTDDDFPNGRVPNVGTNYKVRYFFRKKQFPKSALLYTKEAAEYDTSDEENQETEEEKETEQEDESDELAGPQKNLEPSKGKPGECSCKPKKKVNAQK